MRTRLGATFVLALRATRGSPPADACGMQAIEWLGFRQGIVFSASLVLPRSWVMPRRCLQRRWERLIPAGRLRQTYVLVGDLPNLLGSQIQAERYLELTSSSRKNPLAMFSLRFVQPAKYIRLLRGQLAHRELVLVDLGLTLGETGALSVRAAGPRRVQFSRK